MKTCNDNHLRMANQESNIARGGDKKGLFKTFNSKRLKKTCSLFLSSIVTLSILSVANSSFAFPALVTNQSERDNRGQIRIVGLKYYVFPTIKEKLLLNNQPKQNLINVFDPYSKVDVLYCRQDGWCYISGYFHLREGGKYYHRPAWVQSTGLCEDPRWQQSPLPDCHSTQRPHKLIGASNLQFKSLFFCTKGKCWNPIYLSN